MSRSIGKWKSFLCILCVTFTAFVCNTFAEEGFLLSEKTLHELAGLRDTSPGAPHGEENHIILGYVYYSFQHKILPTRSASDREVLRGREYVTAGQGSASAATILTTDAFSRFNSNLFDSFRLSFHVVQRK